MEHLRPHPAYVPVRINIRLKQLFAQRTSRYTYAFNTRTYTDFEIFNITGDATIDHSHVGDALRTSTKPVVFFLCYDVGHDPRLKLFIRHIVCCVAFGREILFFDMRNLAGIDPHHQRHIETELERKSGVSGIRLVNAACLTHRCIYLQRYKGHELGWCVAWAMYFLNQITHRPVSHENALHYAKTLYKKINDTLTHDRTNMLIEAWYIKWYTRINQ